ncbi:MAG: GTP cyclohydrolase II [Cellulomonadaceae bacterium]|jgi:riboflavin synthase alpha subunit|nr:GTP cyclohydrolase II [Cellulomonadaceae bacterium]
MFTGIVEEIGTIHSIVPSQVHENGEYDVRLVVRTKKIAEPPIGSSIAVDGVCLTVTGYSTDISDQAGALYAETAWLLAFDVMPQTLRLTDLGKLHPGDSVNLERAMAANARFDGHVVQGHVDGTATLLSRQPGPRWDWLRFEVAPELMPYLAPQGSVTVSGVSLTVAELGANYFAVALIPTTLSDTTLGELKVGAQVNIEVDALAKYAAQLRDNTGNINFVDATNQPWRSAVLPQSTGAGAITKIAEAELPTAWGKFQITDFRDENGIDHLALVSTQPVAEGQIPLVRVHSECLTGDAFGSLRCDCGPQLHAAMATVAQQGGAVIYLRGHEGRGIGLAAKIAAYALQDGGSDTVEANRELGVPVDARSYRAAASILSALNMPQVRLLTNNPAKQDGLEESGITVTERVPIEVGFGPENRAYLETKRDSLGHILHFDNEGRQ